MKSRFLKALLFIPMVCLAQNSQDSDGDGIPNDWEILHGSDPDVYNPDSDFDRDHVTLLQEYQFGGGNTLNPNGQWRVTELPFPPGISNADGNLFFIPAFNNKGSFLIRDLVPRNSGFGMTIKSWLGDSDGHYIPIFPNNGEKLVVASGLNDHGEVVGLRDDDALNRPLGFHYRPWAGYQDYDLRADLGLSTSGDTLWTYPRQINNDGEIIGLQAGYGSFYHDWLGRVRGYEVDQNLDPADPNPVFSHLNENGTAIGTYTGLDGTLRLFTYQTELGGPGRFNFTDLEAEYPANLRSLLEGGQTGSAIFTWEEGGAHSEPYWEQSAWINDHGEFVGRYQADPTVNGLYQGVYYFDGNWLWEIEGTTGGSGEHAIAGLNNWPAFVMQIGNMPRMFHEHVALPLNQITVGPSAGANPADWSAARVWGTNDLGQIIVTATDATTGSQAIYLLTLDQDSDGNGLPNDWETFHSVDLAHDDEDGDGLSNYREFLLGLDPNDGTSNLESLNGPTPSEGIEHIDDDGDGIPNTVEILWGLDPEYGGDGSIDLDGDGLTNLEEFLAGTSALSSDSDRDGLGDFEEINEFGSDPSVTDSFVDVTAPSSPVVISPLH